MPTFRYILTFVFPDDSEYTTIVDAEGVGQAIELAEKVEKEQLRDIAYYQPCRHRTVTTTIAPITAVPTPLYQSKPSRSEMQSMLDAYDWETAMEQLDDEARAIANLGVQP